MRTRARSRPRPRPRTRADGCARAAVQGCERGWGWSLLDWRQELVIDIGFVSTASIITVMPLAPKASMSYGNLDEPEMPFSTDTRSDSSQSTENMRKNCPTARILYLITLSRFNLSQLMGTALCVDTSVLSLSSS